MPQIIKGSRRRRIAEGSGTKIQQVNNLVKQFDQMKKLMNMATAMPDQNQMAKMMGQTPATEKPAPLAKLPATRP